MGSIRRAAWVVAAAVVTGGLPLGCTSSSRIPAGPPEPGVEILKPIELAPQARVPERDPAFERGEVSADERVFHYKGTPQIPLAAGHVLAGAHGGGYLRRAKSVSSGAPVEVLTEPAQLTDLILNGEFRVTQIPKGSQWVTGDAQIGGRRFALEFETSFQILTPQNEFGMSCGVDPTQLPRVVPVFRADVRPIVYFLIENSESRCATVVATLAIEAGLHATSPRETEASCAHNVIDDLRKGDPNRFKYRLPAITFNAGPAPVTITHFIEPVFQIEGALKVTSGGTKMSALGRFNLRVGVEKDGGEWKGIWQPKAEGTTTMEVPDTAVPVQTESAIKVSAGARYAAVVYDVAGPFVSLTYGAKGTFGIVPSECRWQAGVTGAVNAAVGADAGVDGGPDGGKDGGGDGPVRDALVADARGSDGPARDLAITDGSALGDASPSPDLDVPGLVALDLWHVSWEGSCLRLDFAYAKVGFGAQHRDAVIVYDAVTRKRLGPLKNYHLSCGANLYYPGDSTWKNSYYYVGRVESLLQPPLREPMIL